MATTPTPSSPSVAHIGDRHTRIESPLGEITLVARDYRLSGLYFPDQVRRPADEVFGEQVDVATDPFLSEVAEQLARYFDGSREAFDVPLYLRGTPFRTRIWELLQHIPYGARRTYAQLAALAGSPGAAQSIGQAVGANPISIIVPCHRVIGADGSLTGYAGGMWRKQFLLDLEDGVDGAAARLL
ncbi:hypothetical protein BSZ39_08540 [Bowdeniella nasicola]|uniref:Methylated-DNA--protein-cysteine methyltransferase n=1 Tax=Bowdeniella nasicola TaxID=208480 RepID=A0A1Q5Q1P4_9ACTO|nr:methylated-DNA--[protein]-cysteine S-methyltransferase [Bowdeniella nasicola]OKL53625.1 hypothetical protein BSZ39_08540 [Bowdeniella nasicola]